MFNSAVRVVDPTTTEDFGNGFLMRHGYTVAWCGWQHDVPRQDGLQALTVPVARGENGPISGPVLCEWRPNSRVATLPMADRYHVAQPTADLTDPAARLTVREHAGAPAVAIARVGVAVRRRDARRARRRVRAGQDLRARVPRREPAHRRPGAPRGPRHRRVAAVGLGQRRQSVRGPSSIARTSSASRRPDAFCATCSISV